MGDMEKIFDYDHYWLPQNLNLHFYVLAHNLQLPLRLLVQIRATQ